MSNYKQFIRIQLVEEEISNEKEGKGERNKGEGKG